METYATWVKYRTATKHMEGAEEATRIHLLYPLRMWGT